jgi:Tol biopolymer transport system component
MVPAFERFYAYRRFNHHSSLCFSPAGDKVLCCHDGAGQFDLWQAPIRGPEMCLAVSEEGGIGQAIWSSRGIVVAVDRDGDERWQLHRVDPRTGAREALTNRPQVEHQIHPIGLLEPRAQLLLGANRGRPTDVGIHRLDIGGGSITPVLEDHGVYFPGPWHPSGRSALVVEHRHNGDQDLHLLHLVKGIRRCLSSHRSPEQNWPIGFDREGQSALLVTDRDWEHAWIARRSLHDLTERVVWRCQWPVEEAVISSDRRVMAWSVNVDGRSQLHAMDLDRGRSRPLAGLPSGELGQLAIAPNGRRLACLLATPTRPPELYLVDISSGEVTKVLDGCREDLPEESLVRPQLVRYPTFDGRRVSA